MSIRMRVLQYASLVLAVLCSSTTAQTVGEDLCSCSPQVFRFTLDFAGTCPGNLVDGSGDPNSSAIDSLTCKILVLTPNDADEQPVVVDSITILELNAMQAINSTTYNGPFVGGDAITYDSVTTLGNPTVTFVPFGLELLLTGENASGNTIVNTISIEYDPSQCNEWPIFPSGATVGWVEIGTVVDASQEFCPAAPAVEAPTSVPVDTILPTTSVPVETPTVTPGMPSAAPVDVGTPTAVPVDDGTPSVAPVDTTLPVMVPSVAPVDDGTSPTPAPVTTSTPVTVPSAAPMDDGTSTPAPVAPGATPTTVAPVIAGPTTSAPGTGSPVLQPTNDEPPVPLPPTLSSDTDLPTPAIETPPTFSASEDV